MGCLKDRAGTIRGKRSRRLVFILRLVQEVSKKQSKDESIELYFLGVKIL